MDLLTSSYSLISGFDFLVLVFNKYLRFAVACEVRKATKTDLFQFALISAAQPIIDAS